MKPVLSLVLLAAAAMLTFPVQAESDSAGDKGKKPELPAETSEWADGPSDDWEVNYDAALSKAAEEHKKVYVVCVGSDWCGWCKKLHEEVLTSDDFEDFAEKNLVLLYLDFPKDKKMPAEQQKHNELVRDMLKMDDGVPIAAVLDEKGRVIARRDGYADDLEAYMAFLKKAVRKKASSKD